MASFKTVSDAVNAAINIMEKFPYKDKRTVLTEILNTEGIENSDRPEMLINLTLPQALEKIENSARIYANKILQKEMSAKAQVEESWE